MLKPRVMELFKQPTMAKRFRGYLPVVVDVETAGFNSQTDALLEIAAVILRLDDKGKLHMHETLHAHVEPFEGANLEPDALAFNGIDPHHPFRLAKKEHDAMSYIFAPIRQAIKANDCSRAILVGHNAFFDLGFVNAAAARCNIKRNPFHPFSAFDTATLSGLVYGQTVLAHSLRSAGLEWNNEQAHSALYDTEQTAKLFCTIVNTWQDMVIRE